MTRWFTAAALVALAAGPIAADNGRFVPIDTNKLVVRPSRAIANVAAGTINLAGDAAAGQVQNDGFIKTFNNLFGYTRPSMNPIQPGPSALPNPLRFPSTRYPNYNRPVAPTVMRR
ncbi:hypothetical protein [Urbifossiella limnaea]|jgi:hypothetical protein|uniref:Uncharacterized protein n=1 Tax=Urbifossiella limnaea TaxID=2528023 RepID=A0A517XX09_9BACT|nr:hypothetical protein [Urbifossiella limnaea]QDU22039.1 hypothetical protein ETAA1_40140 [Urbifossiella limnaea]